MLKLGCSYFGNRNLNSVINDLYYLRNKGFNCILHTFPEYDRKYNKETLKKIISKSKELEFEVYVNPWGVGYVFGGEAFSLFVSEYREACQVNSKGEIVPAACFNNPIFIDFMKKWIEDAIYIGADIIFWDEPHWFISRLFEKKYLSDKVCYCESCKKKYKSLYNSELENISDDELIKFRDKSLYDFLQEMMKYTKNLNTKNALCLLPYGDKWNELNDWDIFAKSEYCDIIATDPYWICFKKDCYSFVSEYSKKIFDLAQKYNKEPQIWVQGFRIPENRENEIILAYDTIINSGIKNIFVWGFEACGNMSYLDSYDSKKVWQTITDKVLTLSKVNGNNKIYQNNYYGLKNIISLLRSKDYGCEWDKKQTLKDIVNYLQEENYELLEEIDKNETEKIKEELGDLIMLTIFAIIILEEQNNLAEEEIFSKINNKMITRHPHIFEKFDKNIDIIKQYNEIKKREYNRNSILDGIPNNMPSMMQAKKILERVGEVGFKWSNQEDAFKKIEEEFLELKEAVRNGNKKDIFNEWGDLWFSLLSFSYIFSKNPEEILKETIKKFTKRFKYIENKIKEKNKELHDCNLDELIELWDESKFDEII